MSSACAPGSNAQRSRRPHVSPHGRGAGYDPARRWLEHVLRVAYRGDWPARWWQRWPRATAVACRARRLPLLAAGSAPLRVGFVSDLHLGPTTPQALLEAAFGHLARARLDVLLLGGDYVFLDATAHKAATLEALVARVPAACKFAVLGNHDLWTHHHLLEAALRNAGAQLLENQSVRLRADLVIAGLDDPWSGRPDASLALRDSHDASTLIVLCHAPDALPDVSRVARDWPVRPRALYVCGHTHGGQLATPWGPIYMPSAVGKLYPHGFHDVPPFHLYVSRGIGTTDLPIRLFAPPDVAVFDLVACDAA